MPELRKVVHVMRRFVPEKWGGTESVVFHVSRALVRQGIDSPIHCTDMFSSPGFDAMDSVTLCRHPYVLPWFGLSEGAKQSLRLKGGSPLSFSLFKGLLLERGVSIIHTHVQHRLGGMARTAARLRGIPYVVSLHGGYFTLPQEQIDSMSRPFAGRLEWGKVFGALFGSRRVLEDSDGIICVGQSEYEAVRQRFPGKPVFCVSNGVDVQRFADADGTLFRETYGFHGHEKIVLCVSRIDSQKNQLGLIRAFARFSESHPDHRLVLIGPVSVEDYRRAIADEIEQRSLQEKVRIIDGLAPHDPLLPSAYKAAEMFVLPSIHEPFGIVILEAWAAGVPVLASRVGGIPGFSVDRETALLVEPGAVDELVSGMDELAADTALCADLSRRALEVVKADYDWSVVAVRMQEIYEQLIRRS